MLDNLRNQFFPPCNHMSNSRQVCLLEHDPARCFRFQVVWGPQQVGAAVGRVACRLNLVNLSLDKPGDTEYSRTRDGSMETSDSRLQMGSGGSRPGFPWASSTPGATPGFSQLPSHQPGSMAWLSLHMPHCLPAPLEVCLSGLY